MTTLPAREPSGEVSAPEPPTEEEIRRAEEAARLANGGVDAFAFAAEIARPLDIRRRWKRAGDGK